MVARYQVLGLRVNRYYIRVISVNRDFICRDVDPGMDNRRTEFYAGKVCLENLYRKQGIGENDIGLAWR